MNHFGFSPYYSDRIELKTVRGARLNVNWKRLFDQFPADTHLANFPWAYVTLIFTCELFRIYCGSTPFVFYLLTSWKKPQKYQNPKRKGKLTIKYTIRVDLTVESLLHIKFSKNCWKSAVLSKYTTIM